MTKLKAAKQEIDYFSAECNKLRQENENLVSKHLIGVDILTPRPRFKELLSEYKPKMELHQIDDQKSTEAKLVFLLEKLVEATKPKPVKKRGLLQRDSSMLLSPSESRQPVSEVNELPLSLSKVIKTSDSSVKTEKKMQEVEEDKPFFTRIKSLQRKFDEERKEFT